MDGAGHDVPRGCKRQSCCMSVYAWQIMRLHLLRFEDVLDLARANCEAFEPVRVERSLKGRIGDARDLALAPCHFKPRGVGRTRDAKS